MHSATELTREALELDVPKRMGRRPGMSLAERMDDWTVPEPNTGCWLWVGAISDKGYAHVGVSADGVYRTLSAAKVNFVRFKGTVPVGVEVRHTCDQPCCVNPEHLVLGTHTDNMRDMISRGRHRTFQGERHGRSVLTDAAVTMIRRSWATGSVTFAQLGRTFGVHYSTIVRVVKREGWTHVQ
jgi:HNH endonuclease/helix-turn-helix, Psq domain